MPKSFHFEGEFKRHALTHTGHRYKCDQCGKGYLDKKSVNRHKQLHNDKQYIDCSLCGKKYESKDRLYVHKRGAHGKGYVAYCGEKYKWPGKRQRHYNSRKCATCNQAIAVKKSVPKFTRPFKTEKTVKQEQ